MVFLVLMTHSALSESKTATGVLSFELPPNANATGCNLFLSDDGAYYDSELNKKIEYDTNYTFSLFFKKNELNVDANAYLKLELIFYGSQDINYASSASKVIYAVDDTSVGNLTYVGKDLDSIDNSTIFTFKTTFSLPQYSRFAMERIFTDLTCSQINKSKILEMNAYIYDDAELSSLSHINSIYINYSTGAKVNVTINNTSNQNIVVANSVAMAGQPYYLNVTRPLGYAVSMNIQGIGSYSTNDIDGKTIIYTMRPTNDFTITLNEPNIRQFGIRLRSGDESFTSDFQTSISYTILDGTFNLPIPTGRSESILFLGWTSSVNNDDSYNFDTPQKIVTILEGTLQDLQFTANWTRDTSQCEFSYLGSSNLCNIMWAFGETQPSVTDEVWQSLTSDASLNYVTIYLPNNINLYFINLETNVTYLIDNRSEEFELENVNGISNIVTFTISTSTSIRISMI